jgi:hypothetical protein
MMQERLSLAGSTALLGGGQILRQPQSDRTERSDLQEGHKSSCIAPLPARLAGSRGWQARHKPQFAQPSEFNLCSPLEAASTS